MKNIALPILYFLLTTVTVVAQRLIDLEVTRITKPDTVWDSKTVDYAFTIKNNGPDDIKITDTILYQIRYETVAQTVTFPSDVFFYNYFLSKILKKGDSLTITGTIEQKMDVLRSQKGGACAGAFVVNETDKIKDESKTLPVTDANNSKCKNCVYYDPASPGLKNPELIKTQKSVINIYPNPANKEILLEIETSESIKYVSLRLMDMSGRLLLSETLPTDESKKLIISKNIELLAAGVYLVEINTDKGIFTGKFIKQQ